MTFLIGLFVFIFGTIVGSFLNVAALRYNTGMPVVKGRSMCFTCGKRLQWYELVPLFSFLFQRGKCRKCKVKISWQYPVVEFTTAVIFLAVFLKEINMPEIVTLSVSALDIVSVLFYWIIFSILMVITVYDLKHKIIPDGLVFAFSALAFIFLFVTHNVSSLFSYPHILDLLAGPILFLPFYSLWKYSHGKWIGLGDGKLALGIGWMLGIVGGSSAIILSFWIGAVVSLALIGLVRMKEKGVLDNMLPTMGRIGFKTEVPFAPFMILGATLVYFFEFDVLSLSLILGI